MRAAEPARGILTRDDDHTHQRVLPCSELAHCIAHFWWVAWDLDAPFVTETLPHPTAHLVFETQRVASRTRSSAGLHGVPTRRFTRTLRGRGRAFGVKLRPGALRAFTSVAAHRFSDRRVPITAILRHDGTALARTLATIDDLAAAIAVTEPVLRAYVRPLSSEVAAVRDLVERIEHDRDLRRVEDAAHLLGCDERALQRRFKAWVGVGPKKVIQRYRLMEAVEQLKQAPPATLAALAAELGYADQAHLTRDFRSIIGITPRDYLAATDRSRRETR